jgi:hypothetical protein
VAHEKLLGKHLSQIISFYDFGPGDTLAEIFRTMNAPGGDQEIGVTRDDDQFVSFRPSSLIPLHFRQTVQMPGRAIPKLQKAYNLARTKKELFDHAAELYADERSQPPHLHKGARKIAQEVMDEHEDRTGQRVEISYSTILRHYNGGRTMSDFNSSKSFLNNEEQEEILGYLALMSARGFPLTHRRLREVIDSIIKNRDPEFKGVGKKYTSRFVKAHADRISSYWTSPLDDCRARAVNPHTIKAWFDLLEQILIEFDIQPHTTWGADETGFGIGVGLTERVLGIKGQKNQYRQRSGVRENVTVMVTIGADGTSIPPLVIFRGQHFLVKWLQNNPVDAV